MQTTGRLPRIYQLLLHGLLIANTMVIAFSPGHATAEETETKPATERPQVNVSVLRQDEYGIDVDGEKTTATMLEVVLDPLAGSPPHRHPGPVNGYVIEGTFEFQIEGGPLQTLKAGDTFLTQNDLT